MWYAVAAGLVIAVQAGLLVYVALRARARRTRDDRLEERLRFETLLAELSSGLIHVPASRLDTALEHGLGQVVALLGADRGALDEQHGAGSRRVTWASPGIERLPPLMEAGPFPWSTARLKDGHIVRFTRRNELTETAAVDRASYERVGTRSHLSVPFHAGGAVHGVLSVDAVRDERAWPDAVVERLRLLSEVFAKALERRRIEVSLGERLAFEKLLSSLSTVFGNVWTVDFDREIEHGLRRIVELLGVERGALVEFARDGMPVHTWTVDGTLDVEALPWTMARLRHGELVAVARIEDFPADAAVDRQTCLGARIKSQIALPLVVGGTLVGGFVFATVREERAWARDEAVQGLRLLGAVFANALARKHVDFEVQRLRQEMAHVGRVSAMGVLTASLAHELNQPLTAILNNAEVAQRFLDADEVNIAELREILADIVADDKRAADVIRRLRLVLTKGELDYVALDVNDVVTDVARLVRSDAAMREVALRLEIAPDLPSVRGDRGQLQQVVLNLVLNALDAMEGAGPDRGPIAIGTTTAGADHVAVTVRDAGGGIPQAHAAHIFDPLFTTKGEGLGMGLAIARTIVEAHGGRLTGANNEGAGATFKFTLPVGANGGS
jgi:signal transduction histidine kinase